MTGQPDEFGKAAAEEICHSMSLRSIAPSEHGSAVQVWSMRLGGYIFSALKSMTSEK
jgi:hypothetical protein